MQVTKRWLLKEEACEPGIAWFTTRYFKAPGYVNVKVNFDEVCTDLINQHLYIWVDWLLWRVLSKTDYRLVFLDSLEKLTCSFEALEPGNTSFRKVYNLAEKFHQEGGNFNDLLEAKNNLDTEYITILPACKLDRREVLNSHIHNLNDAVRILVTYPEPEWITGIMDSKRVRDILKLITDNNKKEELLNYGLSLYRAHMPEWEKAATGAC